MDIYLHRRWGLCYSVCRGLGFGAKGLGGFGFTEMFIGFGISKIEPLSFFYSEGYAWQSAGATWAQGFWQDIGIMGLGFGDIGIMGSC